MKTFPIVVLKFGSSVLTGVDAVPRAVHEIYRHLQRNERVVAVVSALAGETDQLLNAARLLDDAANSHLLASLVGLGEMKSGLLLCMALERAGIGNRLLGPTDIGLVATGAALDADPRNLDREKLLAALASRPVAVVPGFIATDERSQPVLLGRGGSDNSALFIASQLGANCRLIKDVDGIFETDPHAPGASPARFSQISWSRAREVAGKLVQPKAISFAQRQGMSFEVTSMASTGGTVVGPGPCLQAAPQHRHLGPLKVALLGAGVVGHGVFEVLCRHPQLFQITGIAVRDLRKERTALPRHLLTNDAQALIDGPADIVIDVLGSDAPAGELILRALHRGADVVTASKKVISSDGAYLESLAVRNDLILRCSATVGGGLPAIESIERLAERGSLSALEGILSGTCNFMLDRMAEGCEFSQALGEAQTLGLAESDPRDDISGQDTLRKIRILARRAFGLDLDESSVRVQGIEDISASRARAARQAGQEIRLLASCRKEAGALVAEVAPAWLAASDPRAGIKGENNLLRLELASGEQIVVTGKGAGRWPTTESVFADVMEIYRQRAGARA